MTAPPTSHTDWVTLQGSSGGGAADGLQTHTAIMTSADIALLGTVPFTIIPAQGANKVVIPLHVAGVYYPGPTNTGWTFSFGDHVDIAPANDPNTPFGFTDVQSNQLGSWTGVLVPVPGIFWDSPIVGHWDQGTENQGWVFCMDSGSNPTGSGDGLFKITSVFLVLDVS